MSGADDSDYSSQWKVGDPPTNHRQRFENLAALLDRAMQEPQVSAIPEVTVVLDLLGGCEPL